MGDYRKLDVWDASRQLATRVYTACANMSTRDRYELASQMRRAAISVVSNIAERSARAGEAELARFLRIARGSATELEAQLVVAKDLRALEEETADALIEDTTRVRRMLSALLRRLDAGRPAQS